MRDTSAIDRYRIAGAPSGELNREIPPADAPRRVQNLQHRITVAVTAIEGGAGAAAAQVSERRRMRAHQIGDVNVVADAGAVRRRVVGAVDADLVAAAEHGFARRP